MLAKHSPAARISSRQASKDAEAAGARRAGGIGEHVPGAGVRPVQIIERQQERPVLREVEADIGEGVEQPQPLRVGRGWPAPKPGKSASPSPAWPERGWLAQRGLGANELANTPLWRD